MSGTEAVMQAVRLARYHTGRSHLVRFCGAYHGWWGDVQPGIGKPVPARDTYTLAEMSRDDARRAAQPPRHRLRAGQSAARRCIPTSAPPPIRPWSAAGRPRASIVQPIPPWLKELRAVCSERGIVLIFDEVFVGFRLAPRRRAGIFRRRRPTW